MNIEGIRSGTFVIIALDPGGETGWARFQQELLINPFDQPEWKGKPSPRNFQMGQLGPEPHHNELRRFLEFQRNANMRVVCESFENRGMDKDLTSCELIGVVKAFEQESNQLMSFQNRPWLFWQTASNVKGKSGEGKVFWDEAKLKKLGLWWPGHKHAMDALAHLLQHMVFTMRDLRWTEMLK
jgi:hypothetical protein